MIARGQIFLTTLGEDAQRLHPEVRAQMSVRGADAEADAHGVFTTAGSRWGWLTLLAFPVVGPSTLISRFGHDVPFVLSGRSFTNDDGLTVLDSAREFFFTGSTQSFVDRMIEMREPGVVRNLIGARGRVEMYLDCSVTECGSLRMRARRSALLLGRLRIPLRGLLGVDVLLEDGWDEDLRRRTISARVRSPVIGTILEYRGWYRYADGRQASGREGTGREGPAQEV